ncbi:tetratricopeptide repeat protein [Thermodesulfobacteriota bacterium]
MSKLLNFALIILFSVCFIPVTYAEEDRGRAYFDFSVFAYEDGDYEDAEMNLKKALELNPDNPFYNHYLGKTYLKMERYDESMDYLSRARELNPDISGLKYDVALVNYKTKNYSKAAVLFEEIVKEEPENVLAHYHAGISLYKGKKYRKALDFFIVASEKSPTIKNNGYYYAGICHLKMGDVEKAIERFEYIRDHAEKEDLKVSASKWLEAAQRRKKALKPYSLYMLIGYVHDDNIRHEPEDMEIYPDEGDYYTGTYFSGTYNFVNRDDYKIGAGYEHLQTWHDHLEQYDMIATIPKVYAQYRLYPFTFHLTYFRFSSRIESDRFLRQHRLRPAVSWKVNEQFKISFHYNYDDNNYIRNDDRDGYNNSVSLKAFHRILDNKGAISGVIGYEDNVASHLDYYFKRLKTRLKISFKIPWDMELELTGKYHNKEYENIDSVYGVIREDSKYSGDISLSRKLLYDWLKISIGAGYIKNRSNISDYEYKRSGLEANLEIRF